MSLARTFYLGWLTGLLAGGLNLAYQFLFGLLSGQTFSAVLSPLAILSASVLGALLLSLGWYGWKKWTPALSDSVFWLLTALLFIGLGLSSWTVSLPLHVPHPEWFPWLVMPMYALVWLVFLRLHPQN